MNPTAIPGRRSLRRRAVARLAVSTLLVAPWAHGAAAQQLESLLETVEDVHAEAAASQQRIDALADSTRTLLARYREELQRIDSLRVYNGQLESLVASQRSEIAAARDEMQQIATIEREIMPLMSRMVDTLGRFVESDVPFLLEERRRRVDDLRALLLRSDVTVAEKYRRLMEAWQIENDFAHTIEAYPGEIEVDGVSRKVDFLRVGRLGLFYQTLDGRSSGAWTGSGFAPIDRDHDAAVRSGLRIARKQAPPGLLLLPMPAATDAGGD